MTLITKRLIVVLVLLVFLGGCAYPTGTVTSPDDRARIAITNAPYGALLIVDGLEMGEAKLYDGKKSVLLIEPGSHVIQVIHLGEELVSESVFLEQGQTKTFKASKPTPFIPVKKTEE